MRYWKEARPEQFKAYKHRANVRAKKKIVEELAGRERPELCEVCGGPPRRGNTLHFDHCHSTGRFRGWLCFNCNLTLGLVHDDPEVLRKLADYLMRPIEKHEI